MLRRTFGLTPRLAALLVVAILTFVLAATASADAPPGRGPNGGPPSSPSPTPPAGDCAVLRVQLNGTQPATETCLATAAQAAQGTGGAADRISTSLCSSTGVRLYENTNFSGKTICFDGWGTANLSNYVRVTPWPPYRWTWDDKVSSFKTGQYGGGTFYEYKDAGGAGKTFFYNQSFRSMWLGWDNRVSSLCLPNLRQNFYCP